MAVGGAEFDAILGFAGEDDVDAGLVVAAMEFQAVSFAEARGIAESRSGAETVGFPLVLRLAGAAEIGEAAFLLDPILDGLAEVLQVLVALDTGFVSNEFREDVVEFGEGVDLGMGSGIRGIDG